MTWDHGAEAVHDRVHPFADGELSGDEAERFRAHLAACPRCQAELLDIARLKGLSTELAGLDSPGEAPARMKPRAFQPRWEGARLRRAAAVLAPLGVAVIGIWVFQARRQPPASSSAPIVLALAETRPWELRLSFPGASAHRPFAPQRSASAALAHAIPLKTLAALEERRDWHGLAAGHLLRGEIDQAKTSLERAEATPEVLSDQAAIALAAGDKEGALALLDQALSRRPGHSPGLWNRALVLRDLGLLTSAAQAFDAVAAAQEPGWSEEASQRSQGLRRQLDGWQRGWLEAWNAGIALALHGTPVPLSVVAQAPATLRTYFYLALWAAPTRERVLALQPLAAALDAKGEGGRLQRYVAQTATRDFKTRGPLAQQMGQLIVGHLRTLKAQGAQIDIPEQGAAFDPRRGPALIKALHASKDGDLLLGALPLLGMMPARLAEYEAAARRLGDPWFTVNAEFHRAEAEHLAGRLAEAEALARAALQRCGAGVEYRCMQIERWLAYLFLTEHRLVEAEQVARSGLERARALHELEMQTFFLQRLGDIARFRASYPVTRAYFEEYASLQPDVPAVQAYLHESLASLHLHSLQPKAARRELDQARKVGAPPTFNGALAEAELVHLDPQPGDLDRFLATLGRLRGGYPLNAGEQAYLLYMEGHARIGSDAAAGSRVLREAIRSAGTKASGEPNALKARAYSYSSLLLAAGKSGRWAEAMALFAEEIGARAPARCALGVEAYDAQALAVVRDARGEVQGSYLVRPSPLGMEVDRLVPAELVRALEGCDGVEVFARSGVHGSPGLLPPRFAWSYRTARAAAAPPPPPGAIPRPLVVADVEAPASLNLPRLKGWGGPGVAEGHRVLVGAAATPSRVLEEMATASEVVIHAHGLVNLGVSDASMLVLSPEPSGQYALTAARVRQAKLSNHPVVLLAACRAAETALPGTAAPWSLPVAFVDAGARAVIAAKADIPDLEAGPFFDGVLARIRDGQAPAAAVRDLRVEGGLKKNGGWVESVVVFD